MYRLIKRTSYWWLQFTLGAIPFLLVAMIVVPIFIAPLFNDYVDLENKELRLYKMDLDKVKIDKLIKDFFSAFTNKGKNPNLKILYEICIDEVVIIKNTTPAE